MDLDIRSHTFGVDADYLDHTTDTPVSTQNRRSDSCSKVYSLQRQTRTQKPLSWQPSPSRAGQPIRRRSHYSLENQQQPFRRAGSLNIRQQPPRRRRLVTTQRPVSWHPDIMCQHHISGPNHYHQPMHEPESHNTQSFIHQQDESPLDPHAVSQFSQTTAVMNNGYHCDMSWPVQHCIPASQSVPTHYGQQLQEPIWDDSDFSDMTFYAYDPEAYEPIQRQETLIRNIGYNDPSSGFAMDVAQQQSLMVAEPVTIKNTKKDGAEDIQEELIGLGLYDDVESKAEAQQSTFAPKPIAFGRKSLLLGEGWRPTGEIKGEIDVSTDEIFAYEAPVMNDLNGGYSQTFELQQPQQHRLIPQQDVYVNQFYGHETACWATAEQNWTPQQMDATMMPQAHGWNMYGYNENIWYDNYMQGYA